MASKIIVVDDSRTARAQLKSAIDGLELDVVEAVDGRDGLQKISENADASLIFCDVNMPVMTGIEMIVALRESGEAAHIPIVMLTTEAEPDLVRRARAAGAKIWMVKPFKRDLLVATVRKLLGMP